MSLSEPFLTGVQVASTPHCSYRRFGQRPPQTRAYESYKSSRTATAGLAFELAGIADDVCERFV